jgi:hypothetical protein
MALSLIMKPHCRCKGVRVREIRSLSSEGVGRVVMAGQPVP